jgi:hypothetical protein
MIHDRVENASWLTRYRFKEVAINRGWSETALKNFPIPQETMLTSTDVATQRV